MKEQSSAPMSPNLLERKSSFGSEGSCFIKPTISQQKSTQHSTIINNYFINNNIQVSNFSGFYNNAIQPANITSIL